MDKVSANAQFYLPMHTNWSNFTQNTV